MRAVEQAIENGTIADTRDELDRLENERRIAMNKPNEEKRLEYVRSQCWHVVDGLINGGGEECGVGENTSAHMSMTAATECFWGSSGRGNPNAKAKIRAVANLGFVKVTRVGRTERVSLTDTGIELYRQGAN